MSRITDKQIFLIDGEYITNKIKIRAVYYSTLLILALTFISVFSYQFSVDFSFEGTVVQTIKLNSGDSTQTIANNLVEIQLNQSLSDILKNRKNIQIKLLENEIPIYRCKGEIIKYSALLNEDKQNKCKALIAKTTEEDQIAELPANLPANCRAEINIFDVKLSLNNLLRFITHKNLYSLEINQFS